MPIYEYQCKKCGHRFERIQRIGDASIHECPACKGEVERLISASAVQFKGSGFYKTDYAPKAGGGGDSKPDSSKAGSTSESSGTSEASTSASAAKPAETSAAPAPKPDKK